MYKNNLPTYIALLKQQIASHEALAGYNYKVEVMLEMMLGDHFFNQTKSKIHDYICTIIDMVESAKDLNEYLLDTLLKLMQLLIEISEKN